MVWYPDSVDFVVAVHRKVMFDLGFPPYPLARPDRLEAALARPRHYAGYEGADVPAQAAYLAEAISQAQAFMEGNKRTAYAVMLLFLARNGYQTSFDGIAIADWLIGIANAYETGSGVDIQIAAFVTFVHSASVRKSAPQT